MWTKTVRVKSFSLFGQSSEAENNCVKPPAPTDRARPAIKFGHLDTLGKPAVLGNGNSHLCVCVRMCVCTLLATTPTVTSASFN